MTTKTWNALLAIMAALALSVAVLSFVFHAKEKTELLRARHTAEADLRDAQQKARALSERSGPSQEDESLRRRMAEMRDRMVEDAAALTQTLEEKSASDQARRELEARLKKLQEDIATASDSVESSDDQRVEFLRREASWQDEKAELLARIDALGQAPVQTSRTDMNGIVRDLLTAPQSTDEQIQALASSEPVLAALDRSLVDEERATAALKLLQQLDGFSLDRLEATAVWYAGRSDFQRGTWLDTWLIILGREAKPLSEAARGLPSPLQLDLIARTGTKKVSFEEAFRLSQSLIDGPEGDLALASLAKLGFREEVLKHLRIDLQASLKHPTLRRFLLSGSEALSDLVEMALIEDDLIPALGEAFPGLLRSARSRDDLEEVAVILEEYGLLKERMVAQEPDLSPWSADPAFAAEREAIEKALSARIDIESDARVLALTEPHCFEYGESGEQLRTAVLEAKTDSTLGSALKSTLTSRRFRLAAVAAGMNKAIQVAAPVDHYSRALRADGHEFVEPFLWRHVRAFSAAELAEVAIYCLERGREEAAYALRELLKVDVAGRMALLERLFSLGPKGVEIACSIADAADGRAVFRLVELALEQNVALPRPVIETVLRSPVIDFDRRDVYMAAFRMSLGNDFRGVLHDALMDEASPRKDVLLEDLALPVDPALRTLIVRFLDSEDPRIRESALRVLCDYPVADIIERLALLARDPDSLVRVQLARCFARTLDEVARGILMTMTRDSSAFVREAASLGLAAHRGSRVTPILRERLNDDIAEVRIAAARALMAQGHEDAVSALIEELKQPIVCEFVQTHLQRRFGKSFATAADWQDWWESDGRHRFSQ